MKSQFQRALAELEYTGYHLREPPVHNIPRIYCSQRHPDHHNLLNVNTKLCLLSRKRSSNPVIELVTVRRQTSSRLQTYHQLRVIKLLAMEVQAKSSWRVSCWKQVDDLGRSSWRRLIVSIDDCGMASLEENSGIFIL